MSEVPFAGATFQPPSCAALYSSLVPTRISGLPSPSMSPTAGVSTMAPFICAPDPGLNVTSSVFGSTEATFDGSTTRTGNPFTALPSACHA